MALIMVSIPRRAVIPMATMVMVSPVRSFEPLRADMDWRILSTVRNINRRRVIPLDARLGMRQYLNAAMRLRR